jgi:hypothetical protein
MISTDFIRPQFNQSCKCKSGIHSPAIALFIHGRLLKPLNEVAPHNTGYSIHDPKQQVKNCIVLSGGVKAIEEISKVVKICSNAREPLEIDLAAR